VRRAAQRWAADAWPLLQGTAAATLAWVIAKYIGDHSDPLFAPIAAVVALNASAGERGLNAVRLLQGVVVGIVAGELAVAGLGSNYATLALATFVAMAVAQALGGVRIVTAQAAAGAIITVAVADGHAGTERLTDALIGAGVALVFSQILFTPEPVKLVRRAEAAALADMAAALDATAIALEKDDDKLAERAMTRLRDMRDRLADLGRTRSASRQVARRSAAWRSQLSPVVRETENAGQLDLLGGSCIALARTAIATRGDERGRLVPSVRELAAALSDLAKNPGDRDTRQAAADRGLHVARRLADTEPDPGTPLGDAYVAVRLVTLDVMIFAGVEPDEAADALREGTGEFKVPAPPSTPRVPFKPPARLKQKLPFRRGGASAG
jgi:uncharacterized membrane protein YgaE (UPF0421/DUF939 family)